MSTLKKFFPGLFNNPVPYVVLMGDVGTGKSTLVEKLADVRGQSSDAYESYTRLSKLFWSKDRSMIINDTPGANSMSEKLEHNLQIAAAFNYRPVSKVFIVVKADTRIDNTVHNVRRYVEQFTDLDPDLLGVIVTHMDVVTWSDKIFLPKIKDELGITDVIYSSKHQDSSSLQKGLLKFCKEPTDISIDGEEFFKLFKINNNNVKIIRSTKKQVELFKAIKKSFDQQRHNIPTEFEADLLFEFQAYMTGMITEAQKQLSEENGFTFEGDGSANEVGHVANMTNQLRAILYDIRIETLDQATNDHGVGDVRKCPKCGELWALIDGCEGNTECGRQLNKMDAKHNGIMATFTFVANISNGLKSFSISKSGEKKHVLKTEDSLKKMGCGKTIAWKDMKSVPLSELPADFRQSAEVTTKDISIAHSKKAKNVTNKADDELKQIGARMMFGN